MRSRFFGAGSQDDDDDDDLDDYDMSGFVGDQVPPKPTIVERPRGAQATTPSMPSPTDDREAMGSSYAGPTNRVRTNTASSISYAPEFVQDVSRKDAGTYQGFNPLWASDHAFPSPKVIVGMKTVGLSVAMLTAFPALRRGVTGKTGMAFVAGNYAYLSGALGYKRGVLHLAIGEDRHFILKHTGKIASHAALGFLAFKLISRAR